MKLVYTRIQSFMGESLFTCVNAYRVGAERRPKGFLFEPPRANQFALTSFHFAERSSEARYSVLSEH